MIKQIFSSYHPVIPAKAGGKGRLRSRNPLNLFLDSGLRRNDEKLVAELLSAFFGENVDLEPLSYFGESQFTVFFEISDPCINSFHERLFFFSFFVVLQSLHLLIFLCLFF
jgi:hypothetical protein